MKKKLIISESQLEKLEKTLMENTVFTSIVKQIKTELDINYKPIKKFVRDGGEYFETPMIEILADGESISPKSLYEYLKFKYKIGSEFTKQIIRDWMFGKITDNFMLSKNVPMQ